MISPVQDGEPDVKFLVDVGKTYPKVTIPANTISTLGSLMNRIQVDSESAILIRSTLLNALGDKDFRVRSKAV